MISFVNIRYIIILIVTLHYLITCTFQYHMEQYVKHNRTVSEQFQKKGKEEEKGCSIPKPSPSRPRRPMPKRINDFERHSRDSLDYYDAKPGELIQFTCDNERLVSIKNKKYPTRVIVRCTDDKLDFRGMKYNYDDFTCDAYLRDLDIKVNSSSKTHLRFDEVGPYDCFLPVHGIDYFMPIPFTASKTNPLIIHPDANGNMIIKQNTEFRLACTGQGNEFMTPGPRNFNEYLVKCLNGSFIEYREHIYSILDFSCSMVPRATLELTDKTCSNGRFNVYEVGFKTHFSFLKMYRICYDMVHKNAVYAWYYANTPIFRERQVAKTKMLYTDTQTFGEVDPRVSYRYQWETIKDTLRSSTMANFLIKRDEGRFLAPGHLISKKEFVYVFEQHATFFYENTVPQWYLYIKKVWRDLQNLINTNLANDYTRHLIIAGTYNLTYLPDNSKPAHPIYLSLPDNMAVPLYVWKMDYDMDRKNGTVYIGSNNPYKRLNTAAYICNAMPCPTRSLARKAFELELLYCCSKEEFEKTYGPIDAVVFEDF